MLQKNKNEIPISLLSAEQFVAQDGGVVLESHGELVNLARQMTVAAKKIAETNERVMGNQMATMAKRKVDAKKATDRIVGAMLPRIDAAWKQAKAEIDRFEAATMPKEPANAQECRAVLRQYPESERGKIVEAAIREGDPFADAALIGSTRLTGLGPAQRDALLRLYRQERHGETLAKAEALKASLRQFDRLSGMFNGYAVRLHADDDASIAAAEHSERLAKEALAAAATFDSGEHE